MYELSLAFAFARDKLSFVRLNIAGIKCRGAHKD